jgi:hypothetical protein
MQFFSYLDKFEQSFYIISVVLLEVARNEYQVF